VAPDLPLPNLPLEEIRVVDFTTLIPGPFDT
jgi:crotonobetainyl-CoA:carnitine CoA-transferase CaiB-like acyl-CoA transferase